MIDSLILIPARSGSSRVKDKNIRLLGGKPLMAHTIESAIKSNVGPVFVSTDSVEYKNIAESYGATVPYLRPKYLSTATAKSSWLIIHFLYWYSKRIDALPKYIVFLPPTNPFLESYTINNMLSLINRQKYFNSIISYVKPKTHPFRIITIDSKKKIKNDPIKINGETMNDYERSQDFPKVFEGSPACRITKTKFFINMIGIEKNIKDINYNKTYDYRKAMGFEISEKEAFDIDTKHDFDMAKILSGE